MSRKPDKCARVVDGACKRSKMHVPLGVCAAEIVTVSLLYYWREFLKRNKLFLFLIITGVEAQEELRRHEERQGEWRREEERCRREEILVFACLVLRKLPTRSVSSRVSFSLLHRKSREKERNREESSFEILSIFSLLRSFFVARCNLYVWWRMQPVLLLLRSPRAHALIEL